MECEAHLLQPRPYQLEMLEESLRRNVIVAMDTGSGKTHVAVLRIEAELQKCRQDQLVWFIAPRVTLCEQQHRVLKKALPAVEHLFLCGADGVDKWKEKHLWDDVLHNVRVVVSTPDVLKDALAHGFVLMSTIALLVFDEAHHCTGKHAMNQIMKSSYARRQACGDVVPVVLGLTASPVRTMDEHKVADIEANLNATIVAPVVHRSHLSQYSNRPVTSVTQYVPTADAVTSKSVQRLQVALVAYKIEDDPRVIELRTLSASDGSEDLQKAITRRKTFCIDQLKMLLIRSMELDHQLGKDAADWFLEKCYKKLKLVTRSSDTLLMLDWSEAEKAHLLKILEEVCGAKESKHSWSNPLSQKAQVLFDVLSSRKDDRLTCIVFAKQRATVAALTEILASHPELCGQRRVGSFVGSSANLARKTNISDLIDVKAQQTFLDAFRSGDLDLIVSTDVLEEGIDVPACNLVVCFDPPTQLISFMQRRGRARQQQSEYVVMFPMGSNKIKDWQADERALSSYYADQDRQTEAALRIEEVNEESECIIEVPETQALLTLDNALSHLHHFCDTLHGQFVNTKPKFTVQPIAGGEQRSATVILPATLEPSLRMGQSWSTWKSERRAKQDAAFAALKQLFDAGLINERFLPAAVYEEPAEEPNEDDMTVSLVKVDALYDPWLFIATLWKEKSSAITRHRLVFREDGQEALTCLMLLPSLLPTGQPLSVEFTENLTFQVDVEQDLDEQPCNIEEARHVHRIFNQAVFRNRSLSNDADFIAVLTPDVPMSDLSSWISQVNIERSLATRNGGTKGLIVFDRSYFKVPHICLGLKTAVPTQPSAKLPEHLKKAIPERSVACAILQRLPAARNFLDPMFESQIESDRPRRKERFVPLSHCTTNMLRLQDAISAYIMPSLLRHYGNLMIADRVRTTILTPLGLMNNDLVLEAICSSNACEQQDYQRLEFLGDCVLKFLTALHLMSTKPNAPEAHLSALKDRIVSNETLRKGALALGLDRFIIDERFRGDYVKPMLISKVLSDAESKPKKRSMSCKTFADVVESLIGVTYLEGSGPNNDIAAGLTKATACLSLFISHEAWQPVATSKDQSLGSELPPSDATSYATKIRSTALDQMQTLLNHTFNHPSLVIRLFLDLVCISVRRKCNATRPMQVFQYVIARSQPVRENQYSMTREISSIVWSQ